MVIVRGILVVCSRPIVYIVGTRLLEISCNVLVLKWLKSQERGGGLELAS